MFQTLSIALLIASASAIKIQDFKKVGQVGPAIASGSGQEQKKLGGWICAADEETVDKWAYEQFRKADRNSDLTLSLGEYINWASNQKPDEATMAQVKFWKEHEETIFELNDMETNGRSTTSKDGVLSFSEFVDSLDCVFHKPKIEWQIRYLNMADVEDNDDTYVDIYTFCKMLGNTELMEGLSEEKIFNEMRKQSDDDRLTFVEIWLGFKQLHEDLKDYHKNIVKEVNPHQLGGAKILKQLVDDQGILVADAEGPTQTDEEAVAEFMSKRKDEDEVSMADEAEVVDQVYVNEEILEVDDADEEVADATEEVADATEDVTVSDEVVEESEVENPTEEVAVSDEVVEESEVENPTEEVAVSDEVVEESEVENPTEEVAVSDEVVEESEVENSTEEVADATEEVTVSDEKVEEVAE